jgi:8-oxo-dGTP pyrophosphatase MutT (NUDIX family)
MSSADPGDDATDGPAAYVFSDDDDETGLTPAHPAATLVIFREDDTPQPPQLLMVRRSKAMKFAAGAAVFPGGRVDADDFRLAEALRGDSLALADAAARVAAIRETLEETGLGVGIMSSHGPERLAAVREGLMAEQPLTTLIDRHEVRLDLDALVPFARWRPNFAHARVFDARFYLARTEGALPELSVHAGENSDLFWASAAETLQRADAGAIDIIFPTRRNLERLSHFASFADAVESALQFAPRRITPWVEVRDGQRYLCIRDDCGYPVTHEIFDSAMRG